MKWIARVAALAVAACLSAATVGAATPIGADLNLSPKRLVFDDAGRSATLYVFNQGDQPATYSIELVDQAMTPEGRIERVDEAAAAAAGVRSARPLVTFTPRRVTLQPHQSQTVRLRISRPPDLPPGEYRSHLTVTAVPPEDVGLTAEQAADPKSGELAVRVVALFSLSIPVIVREGDPDARAGIDGLAYAAGDGKGVLSLELVRKGVSSLYGDLEIEASGRGGKPERIGGVRGVGVYPEIDRRAVRVPLSRPLSPGERLVVTYRDDDTHPGEALATATFAAP